MKNKLAIAIGKKTPKDLSKKHYTTLGFAELIPSYHRSVIPGQKLIVQPQVISRTSPLFLPTLSTITLKNHAFYVPYRFVWKYFDNYLNGLPSYVGSTSVVFKECPYVENIFFTKLFTYNFGSGVESLSNKVTGTSANSADFYLNPNPVPSGSTTRDAYQYTKKGKYVLHILHSLGYNFNFVSIPTGTPVPADSYGFRTQHVSILPLLAYFKLYLDYYVPSQIRPTNPINQLFAKIDGNTSVDYSSYLPEFAAIFDYIYLYYQNNYFTCQWLYPNAPASGLNNFDNATANSLSSQTTSVAGEVNSPIVTSDNYSVYELNTANSEQISSETISLLQKFNRFIKRNMFSGTRAVERLKARFGITVDDFEVGMSKYYGSMDIELSKQEVTDQSSDNLGYYAGKAWFASDKPKRFVFDCDLHGQVFIISSIQTPSMFVDGYRRDLLGTKPLDFYNPEFDGTILQATYGNELFGRLPVASQDAEQNLQIRGLAPDTTFGYVSRFAHLKTDIDDVTGDFAIPRLAQPIDGFVLPRRLFDINTIMTQIRANGTNIQNVGNILDSNTYQDWSGAINPLVALRATDSNQFNRIFKDTDGVSDPFFVKFDFSVLSIDGMLPLDQSNELQGRGKQVEFESNGVHLS